jgi:arylsulfatase A-like enzyme
MTARRASPQLGSARRLLNMAKGKETQTSGIDYTIVVNGVISKPPIPGTCYDHCMKVLVLQASALHLGFLGCYGNSWVATPHLDRLAEQAAVFDQHYARELSPQPPTEPMIVDLLHQHAIPAVWVSGTAMRSDNEGTALEHALEAALVSVEKLADQERWLSWVDLPSLHPPWDLPEDVAGRYLVSGADEEPWEPLLQPVLGPIDADDLELWERLRCTYAAAVGYLDSGVGVLCDELRQRGWLDDLFLVFTGDRGLALGEHGMVGDVRPWLHEEVVHLPLLVHQPRAAEGEGGRRCSALTQPGDLTTTLLDLFHLPADGLDGMSLLPLVHGTDEVVRETCLSHCRMAGCDEWAMRTTDWAFLLPDPSPSPSPSPQAATRGPQLYAKPEDRWEVNNLVQHHQELAEQMEKNCAAAARRR